MTTISAANKKKLNRSMRSATNVQLGTVISDLITSASSVTGTIAKVAGASGSHVVTSAEASASRVVFATGLATVTGFVPSSLRSGSPVIRANFVSGSVAGTIVAMSATAGSPLPLAENDVLSYIAW